MVIALRDARDDDSDILNPYSMSYDSLGSPLDVQQLILQSSDPKIKEYWIWN